MNNIKRSTFWFWGFIILLLLNISAITTVLFMSYRIHNNTDAMCINDRPPRSNIVNRPNVNSWEDLDFTEEQRIFIASERRNHIEEMRILKAQLKINQSKIFDILAAGDNNLSDLKQLKTQFIEIHQAILNENIHFYDQIKSKLSNEQMQAVKTNLDRKFFHDRDVPTFNRQGRMRMHQPQQKQ